MDFGEPILGLRLQGSNASLKTYVVLSILNWRYLMQACLMWHAFIIIKSNLMNSFIFQENKDHLKRNCTMNLRRL